jgi:hypothetical protein
VASRPASVLAHRGGARPSGDRQKAASRRISRLSKLLRPQYPATALAKIKTQSQPHISISVGDRGHLGRGCEHCSHPQEKATAKTSSSIWPGSKNHQLAMATYLAACQRWPGAAITLRQGARSRPSWKIEEATTREKGAAHIGFTAVGRQRKRGDHGNERPAIGSKKKAPPKRGKGSAGGWVMPARMANSSRRKLVPSLR